MTKPLLIIGENINATRKFKITNPRFEKYEGDKTGMKYKTVDGKERYLDLTEMLKADSVQKSGQVPYIGAAIIYQDIDFLMAMVQEQLDGGSDYIDICVDECTPYPEKRHDYMKWTIKTLQEKIPCRLSIDSSDSDTIEAGLTMYNPANGAALLNSTNLEPGRQKVMELAKETKSQIIANASGVEGLPFDTEERITNMTELNKRLDAAGIPLEDRFLDPLVFPIGTGSEYGRHFLDAVKALREQYGETVNITGGISNVSFGLPNRKLINQTLTILAILSGCNALFVDPRQIKSKEMNEFKLAADALLGKDEYCMNLIEYIRAQ
jgi:cobalamin-dependent methionine synthase I